MIQVFHLAIQEGITPSEMVTMKKIWNGDIEAAQKIFESPTGFLSYELAAEIQTSDPEVAALATMSWDQSWFKVLPKGAKYFPSKLNLPTRSTMAGDCLNINGRMQLITELREVH